MADTQASKTIVLVVEDEPFQRMDVVDMVEEAGFRVLEAANFKQAMQALESRADIGIVLSDINMPPGVDGMELAATVHERWPPIGIILVSGQVTSADVKIPDGGVFLGKPYLRADIVATLNRLAA
jgi:CheY-like chemotaxis protein